MNVTPLLASSLDRQSCLWVLEEGVRVDAHGLAHILKVSDDGLLRRQVLNQLKRAGPKAVQHVSKFLVNPDPEMRLLGWNSLETMGLLADTPPERVAIMLNDQSSAVRERAVEVLSGRTDLLSLPRVT